jgi:OmpA-OmpF porin, OOP family
MICLLLSFCGYSQDSGFSFTDSVFTVGATKNVYIDYCCNAHSLLKPQNMPILDSLVSFLKSNEQLVVEIQLHTDIRGTDKFNMTFSAANAEGLKYYLMENGIDTRRFTTKGMGERYPIYKQAYIDKNSNKEIREKLHAINRRTAIVIVGKRTK